MSNDGSRELTLLPWRVLWSWSGDYLVSYVVSLIQFACILCRWYVGKRWNAMKSEQFCIHFSNKQNLVFICHLLIELLSKCMEYTIARVRLTRLLCSRARLHYLSKHHYSNVFTLQLLQPLHLNSATHFKSICCVVFQDVYSWCMFDSNFSFWALNGVYRTILMDSLLATRAPSRPSVLPMEECPRRILSGPVHSRRSPVLAPVQGPSA